MAIQVAFDKSAYLVIRCPRCHRRSTYEFEKIVTEKVAVGTTIRLVFRCTNSHHSYGGRTVFCTKQLKFSTDIPTEVR